MARMAKKVKVKKEKKPVTEVKEKKPRRVKPALPAPTTKSEFTVRAGRVQSKLNSIERNYTKALNTAQARVCAKYAAYVGGELEGLHPSVLDLLVVPEFVALHEAAAELEAVEVEAVDQEAAQ